MFSPTNIIVLGLGLLFGVEAFTICLTFGEGVGSAALQASGWWGAFSASHALAYRAAKPRTAKASENDAQASESTPGH
jgi:hypothetical protein